MPTCYHAVCRILRGGEKMIKRGVDTVAIPASVRDETMGRRAFFGKGSDDGWSRDACRVPLRAAV